MLGENHNCREKTGSRTVTGSGQQGFHPVSWAEQVLVTRERALQQEGRGHEVLARAALGRAPGSSVLGIFQEWGAIAFSHIYAQARLNN